METGFIALIVLTAIICTAVGVLIGRSTTKPRGPQGIINVDCDDQGKGPELFLALTVPIADVVSRKRVIFDVNVIRHNSQK